jgi:hypothetical protein
MDLVCGFARMPRSDDGASVSQRTAQRDPKRWQRSWQQLPSLPDTHFVTRSPAAPKG